MVKTRYFEASDGSIQPLPDNINQLFDTNFNEFERLEKEYIASYNQPEPEASSLETDFIDDEDIPKTKSTLGTSAQGALATGLGLDAITDLGDKERSYLLDIALHTKLFSMRKDGR